jgi:hypothetical protein
VARILETQVEAFALGSFAIDLSPHEMALEHEVLEGALRDFLALAAAGEDPEAVSNDDLTEVAQTLGPEATRRFVFFFSKIHEARLAAKFAWDSDLDAPVVLNPDQADRVSKWLGDVQQLFDTVTIRGRLTAADINGRRFAITDELGEIYEGRAAPELLSHAVIDNVYDATMRVTTLKSTVTASERSRAVLESLVSADEA